MPDPPHLSHHVCLCWGLCCSGAPAAGLPREAGSGTRGKGLAWACRISEGIVHPGLETVLLSCAMLPPFRPGSPCGGLWGSVGSC